MTKKRLFKLFALILTLSMMVSALVACGKQDPIDPPPDPEPESTAVLFQQVFSKIEKSSSVNSGKEFFFNINANIDMRKIQADGSFSSGDSYNSGDFSLQIVAKANVALYEGATDENNYYLLEINDKVSQTHIIQLYFEAQPEIKEGDVVKAAAGQYVYVRIFGNDEVYKTNAFSIMKLINPSVAAKAANGGFDINNIVDLLPSLLGEFFTTGSVAENIYTFNLDFNALWSFIDGLLGNGLESLFNTLGIAYDPAIGNTVDSVIKELFGKLEYTEGEVVKNVENVKDLVKFCAQNLPAVDMSLVFSFNTEDVFTGVKANLKIDPKGGENDKFLINLNVDPLTIAQGNLSQADVLAGSFMAKFYTAKEGGKLEDRYTQKAINTLNFKVTGTVDTFNTERVKTDTLTYSINSDLNPFVLFDGITVDNVAKMGYFNITVDSVKESKNVLTIHSDFATKKLYFNIRLSEVMPGMRIATGGIMEFDALVKAINSLSAPASAKSSADALAAAAAPENMVITILKIVLKNLDTSDVHNNGVVVDVSTMTDSIFENIDLGMGDLEGFVKTLAKLFIFGDTQYMGIKVNENGVTYGNCEKIAVTDIDFSSLRGNADDKIITNASAPDGTIKKTYEYGESLYVKKTVGEGDLNNTILLNGKGLDGKGLTNNKAIYMGSTFDPYKVGKQKITIYYGTYSLLVDTIKSFAMLLPDIETMISSMIPIYGIQTFETEVEVFAPVGTESVLVDVKGTNTLAVGENIADILNANLVYADGRTIKITKEMITCDKPIFDIDGNVKFMGEFTIKIKYYSAETTLVIKVGGELTNDNLEQISGVSSIRMGEDVKAKLNARLRYVNEQGSYVTTPIDFTDGVVIYEWKSNKWVVANKDSFFETGTMKLKAENANYNKKLKIVIGYNLLGVEKERGFEFTIKLQNGGKLFSTDGAYNIGKNLLNHFSYLNDADKKITFTDLGSNGMFSDGTGMYQFVITKGDVAYTPKDFYFLTEAGSYTVSIKDLALSSIIYTTNLVVTTAMKNGLQQAKKVGDLLDFNVAFNCLNLQGGATFFFRFIDKANCDKWNAANPTLTQRTPGYYILADNQLATGAEMGGGYTYKVELLNTADSTDAMSAIDLTTGKFKTAGSYTLKITLTFKGTDIVFTRALTIKA